MKNHRGDDPRAPKYALSNPMGKREKRETKSDEQAKEEIKLLLDTLK